MMRFSSGGFINNSLKLDSQTKIWSKKYQDDELIDVALEEVQLGYGLWFEGSWEVSSSSIGLR